MGLTVGNSGTPFGEEPGPPYSYNGQKGHTRSPLETKTLLKTQTRWDGKHPTPRSHQRTGRIPPRWVTKPGPPIQSLNQTPPGVMGFGVGRERTITPSHLVRAHAAACSDLPAGPPQQAVLKVLHA